MKKFLLKTPSKINLFLRVVNFDRLINLHNIETVFIPIKEIYDTMFFYENKNNLGIPNISYHFENCLNIQNNIKNDLVCHAVNAYSKKTELKLFFDIKVFKGIPIASGMGGGSSDAAMALLFFNNIYKKLNKNEMLDLAFSIGSDVPYFLNPRLSIGTNYGKKLIHLNVNLNTFFIIIYPYFHVRSKWSYKNYKNLQIMNDLKLKDIELILQKGDINEISKIIHNDLSFLIYDKFPILSILKNKLMKNGIVNVGISGSGPTLFGICDNFNIAHNIMKDIKKEYENYIFCKIVTCMNTPYEKQLKYYLNN